MRFTQLTKALLLRQLRNPAYSVWIVVFPLLLFAVLRLLWPSLGGTGALPAGLSLYLAVTAGLLNQPLLYAQMRDEGMTRRLALTPLPSSLLSAASAVSAFLFAISGQLLLLFAAVLSGDIRMAGIPAFAAAAFSVSVSFTAAGLCLPWLFRSFLTLKNVSNLMLAVLFAFSGMFFLLPEPFRLLHKADPLFWMYGGMKAAAQGGEPGITLFAVSAAVVLPAVTAAIFFCREVEHD